MNDGVEYITACSCGKGIKLGLSDREQRDRDLNKSTAIFARLFRVFHEEHGYVTAWFSDEPQPVLLSPPAADDIDGRGE